MKQFFTTGKGITMTSAQTIKNYAKEKAEALLAVLNNVSFVNEFRDKFGVDCPSKQVAMGISPEVLDTIESKAAELVSYRWLASWLGEAIDAKTALLKKVNDLAEVDFAEQNPEPEPPIRPNLEDILKERGIIHPESKVISCADVLAEFSIKDLCNYYGSTSASAVYGQLVHEGRQLNEERRKLAKAVSAPFEIVNETIVKRVPTVSTEEVDKIYASLVSKQRSYNGQHNAIENRIQNRMDELQREANEKYDQEYEEYYRKKTAVLEEIHHDLAQKNEEYSKQHQKWTLSFQEWKREKIAEAANLKIVIPEFLNSVFTKLDEELRK